MTKGILLFANNNEKVDYVKQAAFVAKRCKTYLDLPVSVVTDSESYAESFEVFDNVIKLNEESLKSNIKTYFDGSLSQYRLHWRNNSRTLSYELSPYDETIVMDTDIIICNDKLKEAFSSLQDFQIYKDSFDLADWRDQSEFKHISDASVEIYWATIFFFRKTKNNDIFFNLAKHIEHNWWHYKSSYQVPSLFRNDFVFSIAIHIMNGFQKGTFAAPLPGRLYHTLDRDVVIKLDNNEIIFLIQKENYTGEYTLIKTKDLTIHAMNKFSLGRAINKEFEND